MTPWELTEALEGMVCLVDTREQDTPRLRARLRAMPRWERRKLDFGDYSAVFPLPDGSEYSLEGKIAVERKMGLDELCQCFTHDRERFHREFERAQAAGAKLYLIVEDATWERVYTGRYRSLMRPTALVASCLAYLARYDCQLLFCRPETTGNLIRDILYREGQERLEALGDGE